MSGLELVGGVSAVLGLAQIGFSLAKAIREVAQDYKEAKGDIVSLAADIDSVSAQTKRTSRAD